MKQLLLLILLSLSFSFTALAQTSTPATSTEPEPKKVVFRATKDQIAAVQTKLKEAKLYSGEVTGKSNDAFKTSVKGWQKENGLAASGSLNRATLEKLGIELTENQKLVPVSASSYAKPKEPKPEKSAKPINATSTSDGPKRPGPFRSNADQIAAAQKILRDGKMLTGGEDGKLDDATRAALKKYQEANGLKVSETGALNAATLEKMGIALTDAQKTNVAAQAAYDAAKAPKN